ncbi:MAG TPA: hypothetical protein VH115_10700 [Solirubrobacteraceae bacterium]|nr:hypothetical protein [Solirubrobacteraceae bacterium]
MSRARRARKPGEGSRSSERIAIVEWAARLGAISAPALAERERSGVPSARAKLAAAERDGLLRRASPLRGAPALYTATRSGLRAAGLGSLGPCRVSASNAAHLAFCAAVAAALERRYPDHAVSSERELRRDERDARAPLASAHLSAPGAHGSLWHRPDLVLWPRAGEGLPTAVEVELTVKAPRRLEEICRAWARARCVAGAVYVAAPSVESALARAIARARAHERVVVVPLAAVVEG